MSNAFLSTLDEDFVGLKLFASFAFAVLGILTREGDLNSVLLLKSNCIFSALANERRVVLAGDLEDFRSFIGLKMIVQ